MLTRESILQANDLPTEAVDVPEWGGTVYVRTMNGTERDAFEQSMLDQKTPAKGSKSELKTDLKNIRARLAVTTVCDDSGTRIFSDGDAEALGAKSSKALDRVFEVAQRLNGMRKSDVEDLAGNSDAGQTGDSTSA